MAVEALTSIDCNEAARLIAALPLFQQYDFNFERAKAALETALKDQNQECLVARENGKIAGVAWFVKDGGFARSGYLRLIAVAPKHQCSGVGKKLIAELESRYLTHNGIFILATSTNVHAREFYERLGYRKVGEIQDFVKKGLTEVIYYRSAGVPGRAED